MGCHCLLQEKDRLGQIEKVALTYTHYHVKNRGLAGSCHVTQGAQSQLCDGLEGWGGRVAQEERNICIHMAGSSCCTEETNTTLQINNLPIKNK